MITFVSYSVFQDAQRQFIYTDAKMHDTDGGVQLSNKPREAVLYHENSPAEGCCWARGERREAECR